MSDLWTECAVLHTVRVDLTSEGLILIGLIDMLLQIQSRTQYKPSTRSNRRCALNLLKPTGYVIYQQFKIQQLYVLPTLYLCVLYLSENKQRLVPLAA